MLSPVEPAEKVRGIGFQPVNFFLLPFSHLAVLRIRQAGSLSHGPTAADTTFFSSLLRVAIK